MRRHRRGQAGAHGGKGVIEQHGVGFVRQIVARKPDFVHAIVEGDDAVGRHDRAHIGDQSRRADGKAAVVATDVHKRVDMLFDFHKTGKIPRILFADTLFNLPDAVGDIADNFLLRKINRIDDSAGKIDMDDLKAIALHKKGRFLNNIVTDVDNQVGAFDGAVQQVVGRKGGVTEKKWMAFIDQSFAHLRTEKGHPGFFDKIVEHF